VRIINRMNEGMIPNRGKIDEKDFDEHPWETVASKANTNVSLEIFFLANLLDITNKINDTMAGIELPN